MRKSSHGFAVFQDSQQHEQLKETFSIMTNRNKNQHRRGSARHLLPAAHQGHQGRPLGTSTCRFAQVQHLRAELQRLRHRRTETDVRRCAPLCVGTICRGAWQDLQRPPDLCCADSSALPCPEWSPGSKGIGTFLLEAASRLEPHVILGLSDAASPETTGLQPGAPESDSQRSPAARSEGPGSLALPADGEGSSAFP